jgi:hypothetical protein
VVGGAVLVALVVVATAVVVVLDGRDPALPEREVAAFVAAWSSGDAAAVDRLAVAGSGAGADQARFREALALTSSAFDVAGVRRSDGGATASVDAVHQVRGLGEWKVRSLLRLVREDGRWLVAWAPSALHPDAEPGDLFERDGPGRRGHRSSAPPASP